MINLGRHISLSILTYEYWSLVLLTLLPHPPLESLLIIFSNIDSDCICANNY